MSEKNYTPVEVAIKVLDKVKELAKAEELEKARILDIKTGAYLGGEEPKTTSAPTGKLKIASANAVQGVGSAKPSAVPAKKPVAKGDVIDMKTRQNLGDENSSAAKKLKQTVKPPPVAPEEPINRIKPSMGFDKKPASNKSNKLEEFIANKKAKKTAQIEKALGMQGAAPAAGAPGSSPLAPKPPKVAAPALGLPAKKA